jgi:hypothetical protein
MSRRSACLLLLLVRPVPLLGQGEGALQREVRRLEAAVDSLALRSAEASALARAGAIPPPTDPVDESYTPIRVAGFRIVANDSPLPVEAGATRAWEILTDYYGRHLATVDLPLLVIRGIDPDSVGRSGPDRAEIVVPWDLSTVDLAWRMARARTIPSGDAALDAWAGGPPAPAPDRARALTRAFEELMFSPYSEGQGCAVEELAACAGALGLVAPDSQPWAAFPTAEDRRLVAAAIARNNRDPALRPSLDRCLERHEDAGCDALLAALPAGALPAVGGQESRRSLLASALAAGGPAAFERLLGSAGRPMGERLAAAAGVPLVDLLGRWRAEMRRARPTSSPWSWGTGFTGLAWALAFAVVALLGSRWRVD